jgi:hypothetical protein
MARTDVALGALCAALAASVLAVPLPGWPAVATLLLLVVLGLWLRRALLRG